MKSDLIHLLLGVHMIALQYELYTSLQRSNYAMLAVCYTVIVGTSLTILKPMSMVKPLDILIVCAFTIMIAPLLPTIFTVRYRTACLICIVSSIVYVFIRSQQKAELIQAPDILAVGITLLYTSQLNNLLSSVILMNTSLWYNPS
jgi:hypothetical protein